MESRIESEQDASVRASLQNALDNFKTRRQEVQTEMSSERQPAPTAAAGQLKTRLSASAW